jgi:PPE-repeat protein
MFWVARTLELSEDFQQFGVYLQTNPGLAIQYLVSLELFDWPTHIAEIVPYLASQPAALAAALGAAVAPAGGVGGIAGLAGLAGIQPAVVPGPAAPPAAPSLLPALGTAPFAAPAATPASAPAPAPAPTASAAAGAAPPPAPPAAAGAGFVPPYVIAPPGIGFGSGMSARASSSAKRKAPEPDIAAAAATAAAREAARARRRRRAQQRDHGDEFMDMNVDVNPDWGGRPGAQALASDQGVGNLGFAGTAPDQTVTIAAGLTTLAADEFDSGPRMPMVPRSWDRDGGRALDQDADQETRDSRCAPPG